MSFRAETTINSDSTCPTGGTSGGKFEQHGVRSAYDDEHDPITGAAVAARWRLPQALAGGKLERAESVDGRPVRSALTGVTATATAERQH